MSDEIDWKALKEKEIERVRRFVNECPTSPAFVFNDMGWFPNGVALGRKQIEAYIKILEESK